MLCYFKTLSSVCPRGRDMLLSMFCNMSNILKKKKTGLYLLIKKFPSDIRTFTHWVEQSPSNQRVSGSIPGSSHVEVS